MQKQYKCMQGITPTIVAIYIYIYFSFDLMLLGYMEYNGHSVEQKEQV